MRLGIAKVDQQAIAQILGNMALEALDDLGTGLLIGAHHLAVVFRVELAGEAGGVHQIAEQHRELAAFGVGSMRRAWGQWRWWHVRTTRPDQDAAVLIHRQALAVNELVLEGLEVLVIELEVQLEGAIGQASTPCSMAIAWSSTSSKVIASPFLWPGFLAIRAIMHQDGVIGKAKDIPMTTHAVTLQLPETSTCVCNSLPRRPSNRLTTLCSVPSRSVLPPGYGRCSG